MSDWTSKVDEKKHTTTGSLAGQWKSPYEILHQKLPSLDHLKVFGCFCYATNVLFHKDKFNPKASKRVFIGYSQLHKGLQALSSGGQVVFTYRYVQFQEYKFPFDVISSNLTLYLPALILDIPSYTPLVVPQTQASLVPSNRSTFLDSSLLRPTSTPAPVLRRPQR
ncbi:UNVERIFIED_CONTAM: hypothetical protein Scaly_1027200 [Sesamum calycinum]|uniref:Retroviral polymerase SH3-like domain-containing protein n=1 Tax=Sesamum calycinum TaxID=2727403 RepID=A0AAW2QJV0_9LAMI